MPSPKHCAGLDKRSQPHKGYTSNIVGHDTGLWWNVLSPPDALRPPSLPFATWSSPCYGKESVSLPHWLWASPYDLLCLASETWANVLYFIFWPLVIGSYLFFFFREIGLSKTGTAWVISVLDVHFSVLEAHVHTKNKKMLTCWFIFHIAMKWSSFPSFYSLHNPLPYFSQ